MPANSPVPFDFKVEQDPKRWNPWEPKDVVKALDHLEKKVRGFGYDAAKVNLKKLSTRMIFQTNFQSNKINIIY